MTVDHYDEDGTGGQTDMTPQKATDVGCCLVLVAFMAGMGYCAVYGFQNGNLARLNHGYNWKGQLCGVDDVVKDEPYLYWCGTDETTLGVPTDLNLQNPICVTSCPTDSNTIYECKDPSSVDEDINGGSNTASTADTLATHEITITEKVVEQKSYPSKPLMGRYCVPDTSALSAMAGTDESSLYDKLVGPDGPIGSTPAKVLEEFGSLKRVWPLLTGAALTAIILGYAYLFLLRLCAECLVYTVLAVFTLTFFAIGGFFVMGYALEGDQKQLDNWKAHNPFYFEHFNLDDSQKYSTICGIVFLAIGLIITIILCCSKRAIQTALGCIKAACECLFQLPSLLLQPLLEAVVKVTLFLVLVWILMFIVTSGSLETGKNYSIGGTQVGGLRRSFDYTDEQKVMIGYFIFGIFWLLELAGAIGQFACSYAVVCWYYVPGYPKTGIPYFLTGKGAAYAMTYHVGSCAMGAFLIAVCRFLRLIISVIQAEAKSEGNAVMKCITDMLACCVKCIEDCIGWINKNAYIDIAMRSNNFCTAAKEAFAFLARESTAIWILNGACYCFVMAGQLLVGAGTAIIAYMLITNVDRWTSETSDQHIASPLFVAVIIGIMALFIGHAFMNVFDHTADTLLYVFCWNKAAGHNSVSRFAPPALQGVTNYQKMTKAKTAAKEKPGSKFWSSFFGSSSSKKEENTPLVSGHGHH